MGRNRTHYLYCSSGISHWSSFVPDIYWWHQNNPLIWWKPSNIICWWYAALYRPITSTADCALLQQDIDSISEWVDKNYLQFNVQKCKFMHITRKNTWSQPASHLTLYGQPLERVNTYKYLGLLLSSDLSWTQHINNKCAKAKKLLGLIYRRFYQFSTPASLFQMYISLVRLNLEYASQVWNPYKVGEVNSLEHIQVCTMYVC